MSGIVGSVQFNGTICDSNLLKSLTKSLSYRGPDSQQVWNIANVGFGNAALFLSGDRSTEKNPWTLDGEVWVTADARIDDRRNLIAKIKRQLDDNLRSAAKPKLLAGLSNDCHDDAELLLYAYQAWGDECVKHIIGDFAFAIWDFRANRLFCARDHLGIRQFYYAYNRDCFIFSNSLNCLRLHPNVSDRLNELAIGDFLLFGLNQDPSSTIFADIHTLPQAHSLTVSASGLRLHKYWTPSIGSISYKSKQDYVERFRELLREAVTDRLPTSSAGISMSGGLDSSTVAAIASQVRKTNRRAPDLRAYCVVYDRVFNDEERSYAGLTADALDLPIEFLDGDLINQNDNCRTLGIAPEPFNVDPIYVVSDELLSRISARSRVALTGWDGDAFMDENPRHLFSSLLRNWKLRNLGSSLSLYALVYHKPPPIGLRTFWRRWRNPEWNHLPFPKWINEEFCRKLGLVERWRAINADRTPAHPVRPKALQIMYSPGWSTLFTQFDAGVSQLPLELRHPLIDLRVIEFLLALPVVPWLISKRILREAMKDRLPERIRLRAKTPLAGDPGLELRYSKKFRVIDAFRPLPELLSFVNRDAVPPVSGETDGIELWTNLRPVSLNQWLLNSLPMETSNEQRFEHAQK